MSTILDALKKVEQERDTDSAASKRRQLDALSPDTTGDRKSRIRKYVKWGGLLLVVGFLAGITISLFSGDPEPTASKASSTTAPRPEKKVKKTTVAQDRPARPARQAPPSGIRPGDRQPPDTSQQPPPRPRPSISRRSQPPAETPPAPARGNRTAVLDLNQTNRPPAAASQQPTARQPEPERVFQPPARPPATPAPRTTVPPKPKPQPQPKPKPKPAPVKRDIPRLTDGSLKVQAIAWSPIAEERMAVVNSKIVREGGSVDDYTVVSIRQDDVVVRGGGNEYRVVIGRN